MKLFNENIYFIKSIPLLVAELVGAEISCGANHDSSNAEHCAQFRYFCHDPTQTWLDMSASCGAWNQSLA